MRAPDDGHEILPFGKRQQTSPGSGIFRVDPGALARQMCLAMSWGKYEPHRDLSSYAVFRLSFRNVDRNNLPMGVSHSGFRISASAFAVAKVWTHPSTGIPSCTQYSVLPNTFLLFSCSSQSLLRAINHLNLLVTLSSGGYFGQHEM